MTSEVMVSRPQAGHSPVMTLPHATFGPTLRDLRLARGFSQQRLAEAAEVSARHLSYLENGRAAPSRQMVLVLGSALDLPLRDRNALLTVAGFAPVYAHGAASRAVPPELQRVIDHLLQAHEPFGALLVDRDWNVRQVNEGAQRLLGWAWAGLDRPPEVAGNLVRALLDPRGLRPRVANWEDAAVATVDRVQRAIRREVGADRRARLAALIADVDVPRWGPPTPGLPVLPLRLAHDGREVALVTVVTALGTPLDVIAEELHIESFFPADAASEAFLRAL